MVKKVKYSYDYESPNITDLSIQQISVTDSPVPGGWPAFCIKFKNESIIFGWDTAKGKPWFTAGPNNFWYIAEKTVTARDRILMTESGCLNYNIKRDTALTFDPYYKKIRGNWSFKKCNVLYIDKETGEILVDKLCLD